MTDIPRDELLDKLAAGWKVRRNNWAKDCYIASAGSSTSCHWFDLLKDDWEGEPPEPRLRNDNQTLSVAVAYLKDGAAFIRRKDWDGFHGLTIKDILANDWEVWE